MKGVVMQNLSKHDIIYAWAVWPDPNISLSLSGYSEVAYLLTLVTHVNLNGDTMS